LVSVPIEAANRRMVDLRPRLNGLCFAILTDFQNAHCSLAKAFARGSPIRLLLLK
jgi:hypothetical protein